MTSTTQGLVAGALGAVLIRIAWTGEYLHFVLPWMRWPLVATGLVLLLMALRPALGMVGSGDRVPLTSWLLLLPTLIVFSVAPPPLGAFIAERRATQAPEALPAPARIPASTDGGPVDLVLAEFAWNAAQPDDPMGLRGRPVRMDGFVSADEDGGWYVTQLVIFCCAADVAVERVEIVGQPAPPRDQWVTVTGTWVEGTGGSSSEVARLAAAEVVHIPAPEAPYS